MTRSPKEVGERMAELHRLRNNVVKAVRKIEADLPHDDKYQDLHQALHDLDEVQKDT